MGTDSSAVTFVADPLFTEDELFLFDLIMLAGESSVAAAAYHAPDKCYVAVETIPLTEDADPETALRKAIGKSRLMSAKGYRKIVYASGSRIHTLVPNPLYSPGTAELHLGFGNQVPDDSVFMTDELLKVDARNVHALPEWTQKLISGSFPGASIVHASGSLIEHLITVNKNANRELIFADIQDGFITLVITGGQQLLLANTYAYENAEGLVYFILFACEQLQLNTETVRLLFGGNVQPDDPAIGLARKYIRDISLAERPELFRYAPELDAIPGHRYFTLYLQALCVS